MQAEGGGIDVKGSDPFTIAGTAESTTAERFGMKIRLFKFPYVGFLCDL